MIAITIGAILVSVTVLAFLLLRRRMLAATEAESVDVEPAGYDDTRRSVLKLLGIGSLSAVPAVGIPAFLSGAASTVETELEPARGPAGRIRQWAMVIDLRSCDGCQSVGTAPRCTTACIEGHLVPEPMEWIEVYEQELAGGGTQFFPAPCMQCQNPPCVKVCPVGATFSTPEGIVLIDQERCIGCRICMAACPYDRRFFNWGDPPVPPEALLAHYSADHQIPAVKGTVMKCDMCPDMARAGTLPYCAQVCPNGAIYYGDLEEDIATNGEELVAISQFLAENQAYQLKEHLGTDPRVWYIAGHGENAGRDPFTHGRMATEWPWQRRAEGSRSWNR
jgi:molybdopterin-containing oxidoreductase family iron-sulfur binding subunit